MRESVILLVAVVAVCTGVARGDVYYEYYEGTWDFLPDFDSLTPVKTGIETSFNLGNRNRDINFGFRFTGYIDVITDGGYTFYTSSDDGSALYIGNSQVVGNDGTHGMTERSGSINLTAGKHAITVTMFNKSGPFGLEVRYEGPGVTKTLIPAGVLSLASHTASFPLPAHERKADPAAVLQWRAPELVTGPEYDVYFGTDPNFDSGPVAIRQSVTWYDPYDAGDMAGGTTYYWRIDVYDPNNGQPVTHTGNLWSFTVPLIPGLVAMYEFETDPNDSSGNGHDGKLQGDAKIVVDDLRGNVLSLDGNGDFMSLVNPKTAAELGLGGNNPKSMTAWVYTRAFNNGGLFDVGAHANGQEFSLRTLNNTNRWRIQYYGGAYDVDFSCDSLNKWVHFALVHDGAFTRMYVNGVLKAEAPRVLNTSGSDPFRIGQYGGEEFNGLIDDFALWDCALSSDAIRRMVLLADFDKDEDVDADDLKNLVDNWLASTIIAGSIQPAVVLDDFEAYSATGFPPITIGWFVYVHDSGKYGPNLNPCSLVTGEPEAPYGGDQIMKIHYEFPVYAGGDDWLTLGHRLSPYPDLARFDEIRFRIKYHADNTEDVGLIFHGANDPPGVIEHEAFNAGPFATTEDPADPNQWHEIVIDLRNDAAIDWGDPYSGVEDVHYFNGILFSIINTSGQVRTGTLYFDDIRLIDHTPDCNGLPATDLNADCVVNLADFAILAEEWLRRE